MSRRGLPHQAEGAPDTDHELEDGADGKDGHAKHDAPTTSKPVAGEEGEDGTGGAAELVDGDGEAAQGRVGHERREPVLEGRASQDSAEHSLCQNGTDEGVSNVA